MKDDSSCVHSLTVSKEVKKREVKIRTIKILSRLPNFYIASQSEAVNNELIECRIYVLI